jgi:hypothetical protein
MCGGEHTEREKYRVIERVCGTTLLWRNLRRSIGLPTEGSTPL